MTQCQHDFAEQEGALEDGQCPICLLAELNRSRETVSKLWKYVRHRETCTDNYLATGQECNCGLAQM